jgi:23S rRNA pseudouridine1911/1915/1917 synthase
LRIGNEKITIKIIYEDNHLLIVEKPVNVLSQSDDTGDPDLLSILKQDIKERYNKPGEVYLGLVHRLDRPVGGIMVFAKTSKSASRLSEQIRQKEFKKTYLAVVHGVPEIKSNRLIHHLIKDSVTNTVAVVNKGVEGSKEAILDYEVLESKERYSLVRIGLQTGRSHQIRVQFASFGHALYGDQKYGAQYNKTGQQIALWAVKVCFTHPTLKQELAFKCLPPDNYPWNLFSVNL